MSRLHGRNKRRRESDTHVFGHRVWLRGETSINILVERVCCVSLCVCVCTGVTRAYFPSYKVSIRQLWVLFPSHHGWMRCEEAGIEEKWRWTRGKKGHCGSLSVLFILWVWRQRVCPHHAQIVRILDTKYKPFPESFFDLDYGLIVWDMELRLIFSR